LADEQPPVTRLVATLPALESPRSDWPAHTHLVGPLVWDPADTDLQPPAGDAPLVFLSASTVPGRTAGLLDVALAALPGVRLACTTLSPYDGAPPPWARVGLGRQQPLLDLAAVVVSGAGNGIVCKGLSAGLPMVLVPGWGEQKENAARLARLGAAVVIHPRQLNAARLRLAVERVLADPAFAAASRAAGGAGAGLGPPYAAALAEAALRRATMVGDGDSQG
jgi:UDP:flavonoid glycosyltransferase YjiC (YdhE family)